MESMIVEVAITDISHSKNMIVPGSRKCTMLGDSTQNSLQSDIVHRVSCTNKLVTVTRFAIN